MGRTASDRASDRQSSILKYEDYLENTLKRNLQNQLEECKHLTQQLRDLDALRANITQLLKSHRSDWDAPKTLDTLVNLGIGGVFAKAHVDDTSRIFVEVGLNFYVELELDSALEVLDQREQFLQKNFALEKEKTVSAKAAVHAMLALLDKLAFAEEAGRGKEAGGRSGRASGGEKSVSEEEGPQFVG